MGQIAGVDYTPLKIIPTEGGPVMHMLRNDSPLFSKFGEVYFSEVDPGATKAWKRHKEMTQHFAVPVGQLRVVLYDSRQDSDSFGQVQEFTLGRPDDYCLLRIPPMVWYGFTAVGQTPALVVNCADMTHSPDESERIEKDSPAIPYIWE